MDDKWFMIMLAVFFVAVFGGLAISSSIKYNAESSCKIQFKNSNRSADEILKICKSQD